MRRSERALVGLVVMACACGAQSVDDDAIALRRARDFTVQVIVDGGDADVWFEPSLERYPKGMIVRAYVSPWRGNRFVGWTGAAVKDSSATVIDVVVKRDLVLVARVEPICELHVQAVGGGAVKVTRPPGEPRCGDVVTLEASTTFPWEFFAFVDAELGPLSTTPTLDVVVDRYTEIEAQFITQPVGFSARGTRGGVIYVEDADPSVGQYRYGNTVFLSATPDECSRFVEWRGTARRFTGTAWIDESVRFSQPDLYLNLDREYELEALFEPDETYRIFAETDEPGEAWVYQTEARTCFRPGDTVTLYLDPVSSSGAPFVGWSGDASGSALEITLTFVDRDLRVLARYRE